VKQILYIIIILFCVNNVYATHNRSGEITYVQLDELTIKVTVKTYTKTSSASADRDSLEFFWGDGTSSFIQRISAFPLPNDVKVNTYEAVHTYPGKATYTVSFMDPNRIASILNVNWPNSVDVPFFLSTTFTLLDNQFQGLNSSAVLLQAPIDFACVGQIFIHNPNAYDADGDSLAYELTKPLMSNNEVVDRYEFPDKILPGPNNTINLDPITGTFTWNAPQQQGEYNIAILIKEYRQGVLINTIIRDMQILVRPCDNKPPTIDVVEELCVVAGTKIELPMIIDDPDQNQKVGLFASGGPLIVDADSAYIEKLPGFLSPAYNAKFVWQTNCNHISDQYYQVVLRAVDNFLNDTFGLATLKTLRIKVVGPAPQNVNAESEQTQIKVTWDLPYFCQDAKNEYFRGFSVWKKENSVILPIDSCSTGLEGTGYKKVKFITKENDGTNYFFRDEKVSPGKVYCYRVLGEYAKSTSSGQPYNKVESLPSNEFCIILKQDFPLITSVSVTETNNINGKIYLEWQKPNPTDLDTFENEGPYLYEVWRKSGNEPSFELISGASITQLDFGDKDEILSYNDENLNTSDLQYFYQIRFYSNSLITPYSVSLEASSIYLNITPSDKEITLNWEETTPWTNYNYEIYKKDDLGVFNIISETNISTYKEENLTNGNEYCYYIKSTGSYNVNEIRSPLVNDSQIACSSPQDDKPPCIPTITITNLCDNPIGNLEPDDIYNLIMWEVDCEEEMTSFNIYYSELENGEFDLLVENLNSFEYVDFTSNLSLSGCYYVTSLDSIGNESSASNIICKDNCPLYELPNTFTPNNDGFNDKFKPIVNRFISRIEMKIFNQWGNLVYETTEPIINWDGKTENGKMVTDGTYYYTCRVFFRTLEGEIENENLLRGHINILK
jgi:gliding motility-associated-like protein